MKSVSTLGMTTALAGALCFSSASGRADERPPAALTRQVSSDAEGALEGVVVTARKDGSIVSTSVTTDAKGQYAFPENRLEPGRYTVTIRAVGYGLPVSPPSLARGRISCSARRGARPTNRPCRLVQSGDKTELRHTMGVAG